MEVLASIGMILFGFFLNEKLSNRNDRSFRRSDRKEFRTKYRSDLAESNFALAESNKAIAKSIEKKAESQAKLAKSVDKFTNYLESRDPNDTLFHGCDIQIVIGNEEKVSFEKTQGYNVGRR